MEILLYTTLVLCIVITFVTVDASFTEECIGVVADFDPFDGEDGTISLICETPDRTLYEVVCPEITESWILEKQKTGELLSGETLLVFASGASLNSQMQIESSSLPQLVNSGARRNLASTGETREIIVIRIEQDGTGAGSTLTEEEIKDHIFGDNINVKTQYNLCSHGELNMVESENEGLNGGVISATIEASPADGLIPYINSVIAAAKAEHGTSILNGAEHIMMCCPPGTWPADGVAVENSWFSGFNGDSCSYVSTTMHELGHNLGLKHASDEIYPTGAEEAYDDKIGYMGRSYENTEYPQMCFNPAKTYQLGWFEDKTVVCEPTQCEPCYLQFGGFVDYASPDVDTVLVKINQENSDPNFFMTYNKATSFNHETQEGANQVVINSQELEGTGTAFSWLEAKLDAGESHTITGFLDVPGEELLVEVESIVDGIATVKVSVVETDPSCFLQEEPQGPAPEVGGDPHITTWKNEHYEFHGQCDLVMAKDPEFADGLGLDVHIRTKLVRFWSYIKTVAIRIGNGILEIEGSANPQENESNYWINYEYQGDLTDFAGFPVTTVASSVKKRIYEIDLGSKFPGQKIYINIYNEFVRVKFDGGKAAFGNTVGLLGDFDTGKTLARDGSTVLQDFSELGNEWQVLPAEPKLFRQVSQPQFPEKCIEPEDPLGERRRRLDENSITEEEAEVACASLKDPLSMKDCVYDILATQDIGMVGAF